MADSKVQFIISAIDNASTKIREVNKGVGTLTETTKISKAEMAAAGAAITASFGMLAKVSIDKFAIFEKTMSGVRAVLGGTQEEFSQLTTLARELGRSTQYSADQAAQGLEMLTKNGLKATDILNGAADATLNLAAATGADLATAADIASSAMLVFGKRADELDQVVNSITGTTNASKFGINDYNFALAAGGAAAKAAGLSLADFNVAITTMSSGFASGSDAGTSFKAFLNALTPVTEKQAGLMQELGLITANGTNEFYNANGSIKSFAQIAGVLNKALTGLSDEQKSVTLQTIFGSDAQRAAALIAGYTAEQVDKLSTSIENTDAAENARIRMDNLKGAMERMNGAIDDILISLVGALAPIVGLFADGIAALAGGIAWLIEKFDALPASAQQAISLFGGMTTAIILVMAAIPVLTFALGGVASAIGAIVVAAAPFILIAAAIAAVFYAIKTAYDTNFLGFRDGVQSGLAALTAAWATFTAYLGQVATGLAAVWESMKGPIMSFVDTVRPILEEFASALAPLFLDAFDILASGLSAAWEFIKSIFSAAVDILAGVITVFLGVFTGDWTLAFEGVKMIAGGFWDALIAVFTVALEAIKTVLGAGLLAIRTAWTVATSAVIFIVKGLWEGLKALFDGGVGIVQGIVNGFKAVMSADFGAIGAAMSSAIDIAWQGIKKTVSAGINWLVDKINGLIESINRASSKIGIPGIPLIPRANFAHGGIVKAAQAFATGGVVTGASGIDKVPAMLTAGEVVLNAAQQNNLARNLDGGAGRGGGVNITISGNFYGSDETFAEKLGDMILEKLKYSTAIYGA